MCPNLTLPAIILRTISVRTVAPYFGNSIDWNFWSIQREYSEYINIKQIKWRSAQHSDTYLLAVNYVWPPLILKLERVQFSLLFAMNRVCISLFFSSIYLLYFKIGKDLIKFLEKKTKNIPLILSGDFNADPNESVYKTITSRLKSVYREALKDEPLFTTWTKRQSEKEMKRTLDYIFVTKSHFKVCAILSLESPQMTKPFPNRHYPSDHLSLVSHLKFIDN